jgi:hypothetical protein
MLQGQPRSNYSSRYPRKRWRECLPVNDTQLTGFQIQTGVGSQRAYAMPLAVVASVDNRYESFLERPLSNSPIATPRHHTGEEMWHGEEEVKQS